MSDNKDDFKPVPTPTWEECWLCGEEVLSDMAVELDEKFYHKDCYEFEFSDWEEKKNG